MLSLSTRYIELSRMIKLISHSVNTFFHRPKDSYEARVGLLRQRGSTANPIIIDSSDDGSSDDLDPDKSPNEESDSRSQNAEEQIHPRIQTASRADSEASAKSTRKVTAWLRIIDSPEQTFSDVYEETGTVNGK